MCAQLWHYAEVEHLFRSCQMTTTCSGPAPVKLLCKGGCPALEALGGSWPFLGGQAKQAERALAGHWQALASWQIWKAFRSPGAPPLSASDVCTARAEFRAPDPASLSCRSEPPSLALAKTNGSGWAWTFDPLPRCN